MITKLSSKYIMRFSRLQSKSAYSNINYYEVLEVNQNAQQDQIKLAYLKQSAKYHPQSPQHNQIRFDEIQEAFRVLAHSELRKQYDNTHLNNMKQQVKLDENAQLEIKMMNGGINYTLTFNKQQLEHLSNKNDVEKIPYEFMKDFIQNQGGLEAHLKQINYDEMRTRETWRKVLSVLSTLIEIIIRKK